ncbi:lysostaphin resistance A-like protein [Enterococcus sp. AZ103]|uniref:CPBP family intramembrane glutamic endopeptidase n=1 Tax=Enterococcus sp. AZ103 TaxID=2774628 RepID=UPI003F25460E
MYLKLIGAGFGLTLLISIFTASGAILGLNESGLILCQIGAFLVAAIILTLFMKKRKLTNFGFQKRKIAGKNWLFMFIIILIQPLVLGLQSKLSFSLLVLMLLQMILVGYVEEVLFRGIFYYYLQAKGTIIYLLFSSLVFGLLHFASSLNPDTALILVVLQVINALLLGLVFAVLYLSSKTIYLSIIFHTLFNLLAVISNPGSIKQNILAVSLLIISYIIYLLTQKNKRLSPR